MQRKSHLTVLLACAIVGCARGNIVPGVSDSAFVSTMAALRRAQGSATDSSALAATRRQILQQRGLTVEQMDRAARALANDPDRAAGIFGAIEKRAVNMPADSTHRIAPAGAAKR